jgi:hypothetical protein
VWNLVTKTDEEATLAKVEAHRRENAAKIKQRLAQKVSPGVRVPASLPRPVWIVELIGAVFAGYAWCGSTCAGRRPKSVESRRLFEDVLLTQ